MKHLSEPKKQQANFFISIHVLKQLKDAVPPRKQSEFVEKMIEQGLQQQTFLQALNECAGSWKKTDHPKSTEQYIRSLREAKRP